MIILTRLEEAILISIMRLEDNAYGVTINNEVSKAFQKKYTMGALYFALDQLHKKGYVAKSVGRPTPERGGRGKTYYSLTNPGKDALQQTMNFQRSLWRGLPEVN